MNFQHWKDELEIFDEDSVMEDNDEPIIHIHQSKKDNVVLVLKEGYKIKQFDDGYGNKGYIVEKGNIIPK